MFERFTVQARQVVVTAQEEAHRFGDQHIGTEHLLLGLLVQPATASACLLAAHRLDVGAARRILSGMARAADDMDAEALQTIGIDLAAVRERVEAVFGPGALDQPGRADRRRARRGGHLPLTRRAKQSFGLALRAAQRLRHGYIGDGHLLLGLIEVDGVAARILVAAGIDLRQLRTDLEQQLPPEIASAG